MGWREPLLLCPGRTSSCGDGLFVLLPLVLLPKCSRGIWAELTLAVWLIPLLLVGYKDPVHFFFSILFVTPQFCLFGGTSVRFTSLGKCWLTLIAVTSGSQNDYLMLKYAFWVNCFLSSFFLCVGITFLNFIFWFVCILICSCAVRLNTRLFPSLKSSNSWIYLMSIILVYKVHTAWRLIFNNIITQC